MIRVTLRNPHETVPLTRPVAMALGFEDATDSSGLLAAIYEVDDDAEIEDIRSKGLVCERVGEVLP